MTPGLTARSQSRRTVAGKTPYYTDTPPRGWDTHNLGTPDLWRLVRVVGIDGEGKGEDAALVDAYE